MQSATIDILLENHIVTLPSPLQILNIFPKEFKDIIDLLPAAMPTTDIYHKTILNFLELSCSPIFPHLNDAFILSLTLWAAEHQNNTNNNINNINNNNNNTTPGTTNTNTNTNTTTGTTPTSSTKTNTNTKTKTPRSTKKQDVNNDVDNDNIQDNNNKDSNYSSSSNSSNTNS